MVFSADETTDIGSDSATPVTDDFAAGETEFNGRVSWVEIDLGEDAEDARPPDHGGGAPPGRDGEAVATRKMRERMSPPAAAISPSS